MLSLLIQQQRRGRPRLELQCRTPRTFTSSSLLSARSKRNNNNYNNNVPPRSSSSSGSGTVPPHVSILKGSTSSSWSNLFQIRTRFIARSLSKKRLDNNKELSSSSSSSSLNNVIPRNLIYKLLKHRKISRQVFSIWVEILHKRDPIFALSKLGLLESENNNQGEVVECPDWLYLSIPGMVTNHDQVPYLVSQLISRKFLDEKLSEKSKSFFLSRCIQHFLKVKHYVALRETIEYITIHNKRVFIRETSFARILKALASERDRTGRLTNTPYELLHSLKDLVIQTLEEQQQQQRQQQSKSSKNNDNNNNEEEDISSPSCRKSLDTWLPLFSSSLIPRDPQLAIKLLMEFTETTGKLPNSKILHQVLKVVVRNNNNSNSNSNYSSMTSKEETIEMIKEELLSRVKKKKKKMKKNNNDEEEGFFDQGQPQQIGEGVVVSQLMRRKLLSRGLDSVPLHLREEKKQQQQQQQRRWEEEQEEEDAVDNNNRTIEPTRAKAIEKAEEIEEEDKSDNFSRFHASSSSTLSLRRRPTRLKQQEQEIRHDIYSTTVMFNRSTSLEYFKKLETYLQHSSSSSSSSNSNDSFPLPPFPITDQVSWTALFQSILHESCIDSNLLVKLQKRLERGVDDRVPKPSLRLYTVLMNCFLVRQQPERVDSIFKKLISSPGSSDYKIDKTVLDLQIRALCLMNRSKEAFKLLKTSTIRDKLDIVPFNTLMSHLNHKGQHLKVYNLFKSLQLGHYGDGIRPDVASFTILINTARYASLRAGRGFNHNLMGSIDSHSHQGGGSGFGFGFGGFGGFGRFGSTTTIVDDKWDRVSAAKRVERLVWEEIFEKNWQQVGVGGGGGIENPLEIDPNKNKKKKKKKKRRWFLPEEEEEEEEEEWKQPFMSTLSPLSRPLYPDIYPTDLMYRSLILLTGIHSHIPRIGQLLGFARYTNVKLSRYTICLSLLLLENDHSSCSARQIYNLKNWLVDWLGHDILPSDQELAFMRRGGTKQGKPELF